MSAQPIEDTLLYYTLLYSTMLCRLYDSKSQLLQWGKNPDFIKKAHFLFQAPGQLSRARKATSSRKACRTVSADLSEKPGHRRIQHLSLGGGCPNMHQASGVSPPHRTCYGPREGRG